MSGDTQDLLDQLTCGLIDFALIFSNPDPSVYHSLSLPKEDIYGVLMRKDSPLAEKESIRAEDLYGQPILISRTGSSFLENKMDLSRLYIVGTYNLLHNASLMVEDGVGYALAFDHLVHTDENSTLCFRLLSPRCSVKGNLIWKKYQVFSPAVQLFSEYLTASLSEDM